MDERSELLSYIGDAHKDAYNYRISDWSKYNAMSIEGLRMEATALSLAVGEAISADADRRIENSRSFDARIQTNIDLGASDRETAIKWIIDADGIGEMFSWYGYEYVTDHYDLPDGYFETKDEE